MLVPFSWRKNTVLALIWTPFKHNTKIEVKTGAGNFIKVWKKVSLSCLQYCGDKPHPPGECWDRATELHLLEDDMIVEMMIINGTNHPSHHHHHEPSSSSSAAAAAVEAAEANAEVINISCHIFYSSANFNIKINSLAQQTFRSILMALQSLVMCT